MSTKSSVPAEMTELRRITEQQRIELERQRRQMDVQIRRSADMQLQLDRILNALAHAATVLHPAISVPVNGNGHGRVVVPAPMMSAVSKFDTP